MRLNLAMPSFSPHSTRALVFAAVLAFVATPVQAVLYKWVDANGRVTYSDQPPSGNVKAEMITAPAPANPAAVREMAEQQADLQKRQQQRTEEQKKAAQTQADEANRRQYCLEAQNQIRMYESDFLLQRINEKGEPVYMDDNMKRQERERLEGIVRERCGPQPVRAASAPPSK